MRSFVVLLSMVAACGGGAPATAAHRASIDLRELLDEAERLSPQLLALRARTDAAGEAAAQREALPDPTLRASYTNDGLTAFTLGDSEFSNLTIGWEQEVPLRSVRDRAAAVARAQAESQRATGATASATLRARVIALYAELWRVDRTKALLAESRTLLAAAAQAAQARYESGEGIQEGLIRAQSAVRRVDVEIEASNLERAQAAIALAAAIGRDGDPEFGPTGELPDVAAPIDAVAVATTVIAGSPDVLLAAAAERTAQAKLEDAQVQDKPAFSWVAAYQFRGGLDPMVTGGFSVRLPVWKDRKQERAVAEAALEHAAAGHDREDAVLRARAGARGLAAEVASIDVRLRLYRESLVPQAVAAYESANAAVSSGRAEMFLALDDLDRWVGVRRNEITLSARRVEAVASLEAITGAALLEIPGAGRSQ